MSVALFLRHGKASGFSSTAGYDELSPPGIEQSERFGAWLAGHERAPIDAVFLGPRKRHAQTYQAVERVLSARGRALPEPATMPELDEHDGIGLVFKLLPSLGAEDPQLGAVVAKMERGESPSPDDVLAAFRRMTRRWVRGEISHPEVEPWASFRARVGKALDRIASVGQGKRALVVTSAGTVAAAIAEALGVRDEEKVLDLSFSLYNASLTQLDFSGQSWGLRMFNSTAHLFDPRLVTGV